MEFIILKHYTYFENLQNWEDFIKSKVNIYETIEGTPKKFPCYGFTDFSKYECDGMYHTAFWSFIYIK